MVYGLCVWKPTQSRDWNTGGLCSTYWTILLYLCHTLNVEVWFTSCRPNTGGHQSYRILKFEKKVGARGLCLLPSPDWLAECSFYKKRQDHILNWQLSQQTLLDGTYYGSRGLSIDIHQYKLPHKQRGGTVPVGDFYVVSSISGNHTVYTTTLQCMYLGEYVGV